jgi:tRNA A37 threonylcarbamoyladenosine biosynthesis protein TsaE
MHADLYRIEREAEVAELGLEEADGVLIVEWADRFAVLPADHLRLELAHADGGRTLTATGTGPQSQALAIALTTALG